MSEPRTVEVSFHLDNPEISTTLWRFDVHDAKSKQNLAFIVCSFSKEHICLDALFVHEDYRSQGMATFIMDEFLEKFGKLKDILLTVRPYGRIKVSKERLTKWYKSYGFTEDLEYHCMRRPRDKVEE